MKTSAKKTVSGLASEALKHFKQIRRTNGDDIWITHEAPKWLTDLCMEAHGDKMPDDYCYQFIWEALNLIVDTDDLDEVEIEADIYTNELTAWLHSRNDRAYYLTQALEEFGAKDGFQALSTAQYIEKKEVFDSVRQSLEELI